jgi:hypothetical protein
MLRCYRPIEFNPPRVSAIRRGGFPCHGSSDNPLVRTVKASPVAKIRPLPKGSAGGEYSLRIRNPGPKPSGGAGPQRP